MAPCTMLLSMYPTPCAFASHGRHSRAAASSWDMSKARTWPTNTPTHQHTNTHARTHGRTHHRDNHHHTASLPPSLTQPPPACTAYSPPPAAAASPSDASAAPGAGWGVSSAALCVRVCLCVTASAPCQRRRKSVHAQPTHALLHVCKIAHLPFAQATLPQRGVCAHLVQHTSILKVVHAPVYT